MPRPVLHNADAELPTVPSVASPCHHPVVPKKATIPHIHSDDRVNELRIREFADASTQDRINALTELRRRVHNDSNTIEIGLGGALLGAGASILLPGSPMPDIGEEWWIGLIVRGLIGLVGGFLIVVALSPLLLPMMRRSRRREVAQVWLAAYEDELATLWTRRDRTARKWQQRQVTKSR